MVLPSLRHFDYDFAMTISLTPSRRKRIRRSDADGIAWMVDKEHYWTAEALQEILKRVQALCHEDVEEALRAGKSALEILKTRMVEPSPDLKAMTLAIHGTTLRCSGQLYEALRIYGRALETPDLTSTGRNDVLNRTAVTLVYLDRAEDGLVALNEAMPLDPCPPMSRSLRGWAYMENGDYEKGLRDCLAVLDHFETVKFTDHAFLAAIINAATMLSCEAGIRIQPATLERIRAAISVYRDALPKNGSNYYKTQSLRFLLSRAQALVLARMGNVEGALSRLKRAIEGLQAKHPDDAMHASIDAMYLLAKDGQDREAATEARRTLSLAERARCPPPRKAVKILKHTTEADSLLPPTALELKVLLRQRRQPPKPHPKRK